MSEKKPSEKVEKKRMPYLNGFIVGIVIGIVIGWWFKPPAVISVEDFKLATEQGFNNAKDYSREELAEFAEELARKLRENKN